MKIGLLHIGAQNLGDPVIFHSVEYIVKDIFEKKEIHNVEIVPIDIGSLRLKLEADKLVEAPPSAGGVGLRLLRKIINKVPPNPMSYWVLTKTWHFSNTYRLYAKMERAKLFDVDMILFCGGGLIKYRQQNFHFIIDDVTRIAEKRKIPVYINAAGVEGYDEKDAECKLLQRALNRKCVKSISTRDDLETLREKYIPNNSIESCRVCDPAFWCMEAYPEVTRKCVPGTIGLNVIRPKIFSQYMYPVKQEKLTAVYCELIQKCLNAGHRIVLFTNGLDSDKKLVELIFAANPELKNDSRITCFYPKHEKDLINLIGSFERYLAVRLHASIIGTVLGVPNANLVWNKKQLMFGKRVGLSQNYLVADDFEAETIFNCLMNAQPYEMDEEYKQTVYTYLEKCITRFLQKNTTKNFPSKNSSEKLKELLQLLKNNPKVAKQKICKKLAGGFLYPIRIRAIRYYTIHTPIDPRKIVFMTNTGRYTCNPKYIYEEFKRRNKDYHLVWIRTNDEPRANYPQDAEVVALNSFASYKHVFGAKVWIDNGIAFSNNFNKKIGQIKIQTMHGSLGIKRLDNAELTRNQSGPHGQEVVRRESTDTDYVITNSDFEEGVFRSVFWKNTPMVRLGHARTDILFKYGTSFADQIREELYHRYGVPKDKKIVMYGPTYRKNLTFFDIDINYPEMIQALQERFGGEFVVLLRLHNRMKNMMKESVTSDRVFDVTDYPDMQRLMMVCDVGITDYSSWIYDYVVTGRPGFLYATDLEQYNNVTGLYYPMEETPFPVCTNNQQLIEQIHAFDSELFEKRRKEFLNEKQAVDDGNSAKRIVDWVESLID